MKQQPLQMSESFVIAALLAIVGGFLDAYSYLIRGHVFANAQTGNIVLLGAKLEEGEIRKAFYYLVPILAFGVGVVVAEGIKHGRERQKETIHWRQKVVILESALLLVVAFIPLGQYNVVANIIISFVCAVQVQSFRRVHGHPFASTMCTGNLRSGTEALVVFGKTKEREQGVKAAKYYGIILWFIFGAICGSLFIRFIGRLAILFCSMILLVTGILMIKEFKNEGDR